MTGGDLAIEASGLVKTFRATRAVDGIDLAVPSGGVFGLLGPNGAGKTTTIRVFATLTRPDAGTARVLGHDVVADPHAVRRQISLTGQFASIDASLTGQENLVLQARLLGLTRRAARARAAELIAAFGLGGVARRAAATYSGGLRRRLDIATSLVVAPALLFLDEPTTGLDPPSRIAVWETVRLLVRQGTTVLLTTQYLDEADQLSDEIAVMDRGKIIAQGTPDRAQGIGRRRRHPPPAGQPQPAGPCPADPRPAAGCTGAHRGGSGHPDRPAPGCDRQRGRGLGRQRAGVGRHPGPLVRARPAQPGRGVPGPDRPPGPGPRS